MNPIRFDDSFNWLAVLKDLVHGMPLPKAHHARLMSLARQWPSCACGQVCKSIPKHIDGYPDDVVLLQRGRFFYEFVAKQDWEGALQTFHHIEERTQFLLDNPQSRRPIVYQSTLIAF